VVTEPPDDSHNPELAESPESADSPAEPAASVDLSAVENPAADVELVAPGRRPVWRRQGALVAAALLLVGVGAVAIGLGARPKAPAPRAVVPSVIYYADGTVLADLGAPLPDGPAGLVVPHVLSELSAAPGATHGHSWHRLSWAGLKIYTTLYPPTQRLVEEATGNALFGQPAALQAAAVVIEPGTGRVLAYYGGRDRSGADLAGIYRDESGLPVGFGLHPPGQTFQVYTLAAALNSGVSLRSHWESGPRDMYGATGDQQIQDTSQCPAGARVCTLADAAARNINSIFYQVNLSVNPVRQMETARNAGIQSILDEHGQRTELLAGTDMHQLFPRVFAMDGLSLGKYPVSVIDQANAMATFAASGRPATAHFVSRVMLGDRAIYGERLPPSTTKPILTGGAAADLDWSLSQTPAAALDSHAPSAGMAGSSPAESPDAPTDSWMIGYTTQLAMAVWIGDSVGWPIRAKDGAAIFGTGLPASLYRAVMNAAPAGLNLPTAPAFPPRADIGNELPDGAVPG
jgi:membrane peptidoglycan carboxypeptidase